MGNDMRMVKFKMMIDDIFEDLGSKGLPVLSTGSRGIWGGYEDSWLSVMYDCDKLNEYGKAIIYQVSDTNWLGDDGCWDIDSGMQTKAAKEVVKVLKNGGLAEGLLGMGRRYGGGKDEFLKLHFLFWALMVLAVDDTDKEEHLSMICAYAKSLAVSDDEMMDLVRIIRVFYNIEGDNQIQTDSVATEFSKVIEKYGIEKAQTVQEQEV